MSIGSIQPRETMRGMPGFIQPYLTWLTGVPLHGEYQRVRWTPIKVALLALTQIVFGIALGAWALHAFTYMHLPALLLAWLTTAGGMRRADVLLIHQSLHRMVTKSALGDRIVGELITTLLWRMPYDVNRREHLLHHAFPCSLKDGDTLYLLGTGMRPGMTKQEHLAYILKTLVSPKHHARFFFNRLRGNFTLKQRPYRLAMSLTFMAALLTGVALSGLWLEWILLWVIPLSFFFQCATFLYTHTEHRWWLYDNAEGLTRQQRDELTFGRVCGEALPDMQGQGRFVRAAALARWWLRVVFVHSPYRMFVLVGDTVQHDLHHIRPTCDWANSAQERNSDIEGGSVRYTEVWGSLFDHLHAAGQVQQTSGLLASKTSFPTN
ncbi:fatty acid desaturase [Oxalobacteraceae bacterium GrIS 1.11]